MALTLLCIITGNVVHLDVLGQSMIVLDSYRVARELLDKRSANYSDRPDSIMANLCVSSAVRSITVYDTQLRLIGLALNAPFHSIITAIDGASTDAFFTKPSTQRPSIIFNTYS